MIDMIYDQNTFSAENTTSQTIREILKLNLTIPNAILTLVVV